MSLAKFKNRSQVPSSAQTIRLQGKDGKPWSISLLLYRSELPKIKNRKQIISSEPTLKVFFPFQGRYYGKKVKKDQDFTLKDLVKAGQKLALQLMEVIVEKQPKTFPGLNPEEIVAGYGLYGLKVSQDEVYLMVKHASQKD